MTLEQKIEYWRKQSEDYRKEWLELRAKAASAKMQSCDLRAPAPLTSDAFIQYPCFANQPLHGSATSRPESQNRS